MPPLRTEPHLLTQRLEEVINDYLLKRGITPSYLAISQEFEVSLQAGADLIPMVNHRGEFGYSFLGLPVKFVRRRNYVEAMPRRKRISKSKISAHWNYMTYAAPTIKMPSSIGLQTMVA